MYILELMECYENFVKMVVCEVMCDDELYVGLVCLIVDIGVLILVSWLEKC